MKWVELGLLALCACNQLYGLDGTGLAEEVPPPPDVDRDGVPDDDDNCPLTANNLQDDRDLDGVGDACDLCEGCLPCGIGIDHDEDGDLIPDACDNCPALPNDDQANVDADGLGDGCDDDNASAQQRVQFDGFGMLDTDVWITTSRWTGADDSAMAGPGPHPYGYRLLDTVPSIVDRPWRIEIAARLPAPPPDPTTFAWFGMNLVGATSGNQFVSCVVEYNFGWQLPVPADVIRIVLRSGGGPTTSCKVNDGAAVSATIPFTYPVTLELIATLPAAFLYVDIVQ